MLISDQAPKTKVVLTMLCEVSPIVMVPLVAISVPFALPLCIVTLNDSVPSVKLSEVGVTVKELVPLFAFVVGKVPDRAAKSAVSMPLVPAAFNLQKYVPIGLYASVSNVIGEPSFTLVAPPLAPMLQSSFSAAH